MVEQKLPKLKTGVRSSSPAPDFGPGIPDSKRQKKTWMLRAPFDRAKRDEEMHALWRSGKSLRQIGMKYKVTPTAACAGVRRHLSKIAGAGHGK